MEILVKTPLGLEEVCASRIAELDPGAEMVVRPGGYVGLVGVVRCSDPDGLYSRISSEILEAENVYRVKAVSEARLEKMSDAAVKAAGGLLGPEKSFAVRTVRRGRHSFTSLDVNVAVGAAIQREFSALVDLDHPD
ncbi:MAG: THUMP domain-containing protein, partial [Nitrososphaerota archaeon]